MESEDKRTHLTAAPHGIPPIPPGFVSSTSFTLKRNPAEAMPLLAPQADLDMQRSSVCYEKYRKLLFRRPWVNFKEVDNGNCGDGPEFGMFERHSSPVHRLPKGVICGCSECEDCQMVSARWRPENSNRPDLDEAPTFYPDKDEFEDTLKYISHIRPIAETYGICRIVPPPSWKNPCTLKQNGVWEKSKFSTRIQEVDKLQKHDSRSGTCRDYMTIKRKRQKISKFEPLYAESDEKTRDVDDSVHTDNVVRLGFQPGPDFTLESFQKYADNFKDQYFQIKDMHVTPEDKASVPSIEDIEGEYWRIIESPTEEIEVLYGADLDTRAFCSGFPKACPTLRSELEYYVKSGWNLNNFPRLPGSMLSFESEDLSGVIVPWLYVGMCFSSFCWHVEDHHLYSLNYLHSGSPKVWYGVPGSYAFELEAAMKKHLPNLFEEQPDLLHYLVTQFSPSILKQEGVPVYRCVQNPGEFILTFPRAYHSGFNCGFNCAEAVNGAPLDWLPHGQNVIELYREQRRSISISFDKLLLGASREAVRAQWNNLFERESSPDSSVWKNACGPESILAKTVKERIEMERVESDFLSCSSRSLKMNDDLRSKSDPECFVCHYDLHLWAAGCSCSPNILACLIHAKDLCSCPWTRKYFVFRYDLHEMNNLVSALSGKQSAVYRWGKLDLGLSLTSVANRDVSEQSKQTIICSRGPDRADHEDMRQDMSVKSGYSRTILKKVLSPVVSDGNNEDYSSSHHQYLQQEKCNIIEGMSSSSGVFAKQSSNNCTVKEEDNCVMPDVGGHLPLPQPSETQSSNAECKGENNDSRSDFIIIGQRSTRLSRTCQEKNVSRYSHFSWGTDELEQVGEWRYSVEVLESGVNTGKQWCTTEAKFPEVGAALQDIRDHLTVRESYHFLSNVPTPHLLKNPPVNHRFISSWHEQRFQEFFSSKNVHTYAYPDQWDDWGFRIREMVVRQGWWPFYENKEEKYNDIFIKVALANLYVSRDDDAYIVHTWTHNNSFAISGRRIAAHFGLPDEGQRNFQTDPWPHATEYPKERCLQELGVPEADWRKPVRELKFSEDVRAVMLFVSKSLLGKPAKHTTNLEIMVTHHLIMHVPMHFGHLIIYGWLETCRIKSRSICFGNILQSILVRRGHLKLPSVQTRSNTFGASNFKKMKAQKRYRRDDDDSDDEEQVQPQQHHLLVEPVLSPSRERSPPPVASPTPFSYQGFAPSTSPGLGFAAFSTGAGTSTTPP